MTNKPKAMSLKEWTDTNVGKMWEDKNAPEMIFDEVNEIELHGVFDDLKVDDKFSEKSQKLFDLWLNDRKPLRSSPMPMDELDHWAEHQDKLSKNINPKFTIPTFMKGLIDEITEDESRVTIKLKACGGTLKSAAYLFQILAKAGHKTDDAMKAFNASLGTAIQLLNPDDFNGRSQASASSVNT